MHSAYPAQQHPLPTSGTMLLNMGDDSLPIPSPFRGGFALDPEGGAVLHRLLQAAELEQQRALQERSPLETRAEALQTLSPPRAQYTLVLDSDVSSQSYLCAFSMAVVAA